MPVASALHSEECERAILACILLQPEMIRTIANPISIESFFFRKHQDIFRAMLEIWEDAGDSAIDLRTLQAQLERNGTLTAAGGLAYLSTLDLDLPDLSGLENYCKIVKDLHIRRRLVDSCRQLVADAQSSDFDLDQLLANAGSSYRDLESEAGGAGGFIHLGETFDAFDWTTPPQNLAGLTTGLPDLDRLTLGCGAGDLVILSARTSMGKTSLMLQMIEAQARSGARVGVASLEMSLEQLAQRLVAQRTGIPLVSLRSYRLSDTHRDHAASASRQLSSLGVWADETALTSAEQICAKARRQHSVAGLDALWVDYLGLLKLPGGKSAAERATALGEASAQLRALAKDLAIPVICLHQISREATRRPGGRPTLADLRESGKLEENADGVWFPHRPAYYDSSLRNGNAEDAELIVAKNRQGPVATVELVWKPKTLTFASKHPDELNPHLEPWKKYSI